MPIAELAEDRVVEGLFAVASKRRRRTRSGSPYLALELVDPTGKIEARVWNDVELLEWAGFGVAVANAHPRVLAVADWVCPSAAEEGVAQVMDALLDSRA